VALDLNQLPDDPQILRKIVLDLAAQLDWHSLEKSKLEGLLRELLDARRAQKSERLSEEQLALFEAVWQAQQPAAETPADEDGNDDLEPPSGGVQPDENAGQAKKPGGRQPLSPNLKRQRIVHDLPEADKHCASCAQDLRHIGEDTSSHYEYIPASLIVIEDACLKYACGCTVRTAGKPPQPIEKSTAGASLLAQVVVAKFADHQPLHR
jgi:transposase